MNKKIIFIILAIIVLVFAVFVFQQPSEKTVMEDPVKRPDQTGDVVKANNQFALDFYKEIKDAEANIFFSPYSLSIALAMTYEGARGETAEEMRNVFYFPQEDGLNRPLNSAYSDQCNLF